MFLRFVTERRPDHGARREGIFQAAYAARRDAETPGYHHIRFIELLAWFNDDRDEPDRFNLGSRKTGHRSQTTGLSWFRPEASKHVETAFELCSVLNELGYPITVLKTLLPGFILYEDRYQIVAEPFADTPT